MSGQVRYDLFFWEMMRVLQDASGPLTPDQVMDTVAAQVQPTAVENESDRRGRTRWKLGLRFDAGDAATVGWMTKRGGWAIVESGIEALDAFPAPDVLHAELRRRYRDIDGEWTTWDDLARLVGETPDEVGHFLASGKVQIPNAYRVLTPEGRIPDEGMLNATYRGTDLRKRLAQEGVRFSASGQADREQRLTADSLKYLIEERQAEERHKDDEEPRPAKRAWMVRGSNVDGYNLVPRWLDGGYVELSASQLGSLPLLPTFDELKDAVETAYEHKSYAYRGQRLDELDRFIRRMRPGDLVRPARFCVGAAAEPVLRR